MINQLFDPQQPLLFVAAFAVLWLAVSMALAVLSGWWTLAQYYRGRVRNPRGKWYFQSASLRMYTGYNNVLTVAVGEEGLSFALLLPLLAGHPSLLFPWAHITARPGRLLFMDVVTLSFRNTPGVALRINKGLSDRIRQASDGRWDDCFKRS